MYLQRRDSVQVGELFASFSLDTSGFAHAMVEIEDELGQFGARLATIGAGLEQAITQPILSFAKDSLGAGMNFTAQMSTVEAISGATGESLEALTQAAIDAGSATKFTATEAGQALQYMAMAGWGAEEMLGGLRPIMDLAAASGAELARTSDIVTDAMTAFGYAADDTYKIIANGETIDTGISNVQHFADVLAATATNSNTNVEMLGESFKYAAPLAGALGYSIEDVALAAGLMANQGIKASQAGTTLRSLFKRLADPPKAARTAMEEYGISLTDVSGNMLGLREVLEQLRSKAAEMTETEKAAFASAIAGTTGMSGLLALLNATEADLTQLETAIGSCTDATEKMANVQLNNAKGAITIMKSALEGLQITLFSLVEDGIMKGIEGITGLINAFREADSSMQIAAMGFLGITAAIGPAMKAIGILIPMLSALASPFGLLVAGAALFGTTLLDMTTTAEMSLTDVSGTAQKTAGQFTSMLKSASTSGTRILTGIESKAKQVIQAVSGHMPEMIGTMAEAAEAILPTMMSGILNVLSELTGEIAGHLPEMADLGISIVGSVADGILSGMPNVLAAATRFMTELLRTFTNLDRITGFMNRLRSSIRDAIAGTDWQGLGNQIAGAFEESLTNIRGLLEKAKEAFLEIDLGKWADSIRDGLGSLKGSLDELLFGDTELGDFEGLGVKIHDRIQAGFTAVFAGIGEWIRAREINGQELGQKLAEGIRSGLSSLGGFLKGLLFGDMNAREFAESLVSGIRTGFSTLTGFFSSFFRDNMPDGTSFVETGRNIAISIKNGFLSAATTISTLIFGESDGDYTAMGTKIAGLIRSGLASLSGILTTFLLPEGEDFRGLGARIAEKIRSGMESVGNLIHGLILGNESENWQEVGKQIVSAIGAAFEVRRGFLETMIFGEAAELDWTAKGKYIAERIREGVKTVGTLIMDILGVEGNGAPDFLKIGSGIAERIREGIGSAGNFLAGFAEEMLADNPLSGVGEKIGEEIAKGFEAGKSKIGEMLSSLDVESIAASLGGKLSDALSSIRIKENLATLLGLESEETQNWENIGREVVQAILHGMESVKNAGTSFLKGLILGDEAALTGSMAEAGEHLFHALLDGITAAMSATGTLAGQLVESLLRFDWVSTGGELGLGLIRGILDAFTTLSGGIENILQEIFRGAKYAVLSWFGIEIDEMERAMNEMVFDLDGGKITGEALKSLIGSSSATITEQARAYVMLVQAGFEEQAGQLDFTPTAVALAARIEDGSLVGQERIQAAAALIFSGFGDSIMMNDFGLYSAAMEQMEELTAGIEAGTDITIEACRNLGIEIPGTLSEALGMGITEVGPTMSAGLMAAMDAVSAEMDEYAASLGESTSGMYIAGVDTGLAAAEIDGTPVKEALEMAADLAAAEAGTGIGETVMEAAGAAIEASDVIRESARKSTSSEVFAEAEGNARQAGDQIGGALAPEIRAHITETSLAVAELAGAIDGAFLPMETSIAEHAKAAMSNLKAVLQEMKTEVEADLAEMFGSLGTIALPEMEADTGNMPNLADSLIEGLDVLSGKLVAIVETELSAVRKSVADANTALLEAEQGFADAVIIRVQSLGDTLSGIFTGTEDMIRETVNTFLSDLETTTKAAGDRLMTGFRQLSTEGTEVARQMMAALKREMTAGTIEIQTVCLQLESAISTILSRFPEIFRTQGMQSMQALASAFSQRSSVTEAVSSLTSSVLSQLRNALSSSAGSSIGRNLVSGLESGIRNAAGNLASIASSVASKAVSAMKDTLKIHSPSGVTMEIGENMDAGLALGLASGKAMEAAELLAEKTAKAMAEEVTIPDISRSQAMIQRNQARETGIETAKAIGESRDDARLAMQVAEILAERLISSGVFRGDVYLDGNKVGEQVAAPVSRQISDQSKRTLRGRSASLVLS